MPMTLDHKTETLYRWLRWCDGMLHNYGYRKVHTANAMDWNRYLGPIDVLMDAGYCLDRPS